MGKGSSKAGKGNSRGGGSVSPITYRTPSQREEMNFNIKNQFFDNYRQYGADAEKANNMIIDELLKDGLIDKKMADNLRDSEKKIKKLEMNAADEQKKLRAAAEKAEKKINEKLESREKAAENKSKQSNEGGGLGLNPGYTAVTSTYKRAEKRRKRKFDDWWNANH